MTMCDSKYPTNVAFAFLESLKLDFTSKFNQSDIDNSIPYSFNSDFKTNIMCLMVW